MEGFSWNETFGRHGNSFIHIVSFKDGEGVDRSLAGSVVKDRVEV